MTAVSNSRTTSKSGVADVFPLRRRLSVVSLLVMLATASILIFLYRADQIEEHTAIAATENEKTLTYLIRVLDVQLSGFFGSDAHSPHEIADLDAMLSATLENFREHDVLKLKLYDLRGEVIYSSARSEIGGGSVHPELLARALRGETVHRVEFRKSFMGRTGEMRDVYVALTYMPLTHAGKRIGAIELYDDKTPIFNRLHAHIVEIALIVLGAFALLYGALFFAVSGGDRAIARWRKSIADSEAELRESQLIAGLGTYILDIRSGVWDSSDVLDRIFGIDKSYPHSVEGWRELLHPDNRTAMIDYLANDVIAQRRPFDKEFRVIRHSDQQWRWVHGLGKLEFDDQGRPVKMHGTLQDITERKQAELSLAESRNLLQVIIDTAPVRIFWKDRELRYLGCNPAFAQDAGLETTQEVVGKDDFQLGWSAQAEQYRADDRQVIETGMPKLSYPELCINLQLCDFQKCSAIFLIFRRNSPNPHWRGKARVSYWKGWVAWSRVPNVPGHGEARMAGFLLAGQSR